MADTLTLAGVSVLGLSPGSSQVLLDRGADIGSPTPDTATISSLLLDGDQITGDRYGNRTFVLPFVVFGADRTTLASTLDAFLEAVSATTWKMVWQPNGGFQTIWNCYRATPTVTFSPRDQGTLKAHVSLAFPAQPFAFSANSRTDVYSATGTHGTTWPVSSFLGSARTPLAVKANRAGLGAMVDLLLHAPPSTQDANLTIFAALSGGAATIAAANMKYAGTYSIVALLSASDTVSRTITATVQQKLSGTTIATFTPSTTVVGALTMVTIGEINLPVVPIPAENVSSSMVITITSTGSDTFSDVALCDTKGQTIILTGLSSAVSAWVDAPDPMVGVGPIYISSTNDRTLAVSALKQALISGGPMLLEPGSNRFMAASTSGAPNASLTYTPAYLHEATS